MKNSTSKFPFIKLGAIVTALALLAGCATAPRRASLTLSERLRNPEKLKTQVIDLKPCVQAALANLPEAESRQTSRAQPVEFAADCSRLPHKRIFGFTLVRSAKQMFQGDGLVSALFLRNDLPLRFA